MKMGNGLSAALLLSATAMLSAQETSKDQKSLEGNWTPTTVEIGGTKFPAAELKIWKLIISGNTYKVFVDEKTDQGTIAIDAAKKPKTMNITGTDGPNKGKTFLAIYETQGDTLRICYDLSGKGRPTEFKTEKGAPLFLATYQREKK
jgi:uncharacterized protein (TIGR03067 family)